MSVIFIHCQNMRNPRHGPTYYLFVYLLTMPVYAVFLFTELSAQIYGKSRCRYAPKLHKQPLQYGNIRIAEAVFYLPKVTASAVVH